MTRSCNDLRSWSYGWDGGAEARMIDKRSYSAEIGSMLQPTVFYWQADVVGGGIIAPSVPVRTAVNGQGRYVGGKQAAHDVDSE